MKEIQETLKNLDLHTDRPSLLGLLSKSWERQKTLYPEKITDDATKAASEQMSLATIIDDIDDQDNWYNEMPTWLWLPDIFRGNDKKTEALKIMAPNIEKWGDLSLENIEKVYNPLDKTNLPAPTEPEKALLDSI